MKQIGNEDNLGGGNSSYSSYRLPMFTSAIKAVYPDITIIASTPQVDPIPDDISLDYHEYSRPDNFVHEFSLFDHYNRSHPILIGKLVPSLVLKFATPTTVLRSSYRSIERNSHYINAQSSMQ